MEHAPANPSSRFRALRYALGANAAFSTLCGLGFLRFAEASAARLGGADALAYQALGALLLGFAVLVAWTAWAADTRAALAVSVADIGWVLGTSVLLLVLPFTGLGVAAVWAVNACVALFAWGQLRGIREAYRVDDDAFALCMEMRVSAAPTQVFDAVADLPAIHTHASWLTSSVLREGTRSEPGAVRQCTTRKGEAWAERCVALDRERRTLELEFLCDEPDFPMPFEQMRGGWHVLEEEGGSRVRVWWRMVPKHAALAAFLPLIAEQQRRQMGPVIRSLAGESEPTSLQRRPVFC